MQARVVSPELREKIESLYQSARQLEPHEWPSYLNRVCAGDLSLRHEVESLLSAHEEEIGMAPSVSENPTEILPEKSGIRVGQAIAHYKVISLLGRGGMGEVYLAHDTRLGRNVALKVLPKALNTDDDRLRRFAREARSASALNHPNVSVIHEIGVTESGRHFIAMEHIEGTTLRERLRQGTLRIDEAINIAQQVTNALMAAHKAGVVHRDIKPENIMIRPDGYVKVLDFGLAKLTERYGLPMDSEAATFPIFDTNSYHLLGTVNYLSPEQARRQLVDERTDIWSLGVVLYEMLAGSMPFEGETPSHAIVAILEREPEPIVNRLEKVPDSLELIIKKTLSKDRANRYQTASDLAADLNTLKLELSTGPFQNATPQPKKLWNSRSAYLTAVIVMLFVAAGALLLLNRNSNPAAGINSLAVLPFVNSSNDPNMDYLSDGITDSIIDNLSHVPNLKVIGRSSAFRYRGQQVDAYSVGQDLGVQTVLIGRIVEHDGELLISVDLEDARDRTHIWGNRYNRKMADLLTVQDEISQIVAAKLRLRISGEDAKRLTKRYTDNIEAYQLYLKGRWSWNKRTIEAKREAATYFKQAIDLDLNYALAYAGLADVYVLDSTVPYRESYLRAKAATARALEIDSTLGEAHATLGFIKSHYEKDWKDGEAEFKRAIELNPNYATAHHWYADQLLARGLFDQSLSEFRRAQELDPLSPIISTDLGLVYFYSRDYDRAIEHFRSMVGLFPEFFPAHMYLGWAYTQKQMYPEALMAFQQATLLTKGHTMVEAVTGYAYAVSGNRVEALKTLKDLETRSRSENVPPLRFAILYAGLGEKDKAIEWLNRASDELDMLVIYLKVSPFFDSLRKDPRFDVILRRINLAS